jgi:hypothetical protein
MLLFGSDDAIHPAREWHKLHPVVKTPKSRFLRCGLLS